MPAEIRGAPWESCRNKWKLRVRVQQSFCSGNSEQLDRMTAGALIDVPVSIFTAKRGVCLLKRTRAGLVLHLGLYIEKHEAGSHKQALNTKDSFSTLVLILEITVFLGMS